MREGWELKNVRDVTIFKSGKTISKDSEKQFGDIIYAKVGDMNLEGNELEITTSSRFVDLKDINENQIIPIGSIIFPKRGGAIATNKKRIIVKPTIVDLNTMALCPTEKLISGFLYYWISSMDLADLSNGTSIPQINNNSFDNVFITFPNSISEQKQIVAILDKAFAAIDQAKANIEKNIENAKELFQSKLNEIFSQKGGDSASDTSSAEKWENKKLKEITSKIGSGATPRGGQASYKESGISLIRSMNVHDGGFRKRKLAFIDEEQARKLDNVEIFEKDVLLNITGASVARCCIVDTKYLPARVNQHVSIIRIKDGIMNPKFLHFALTSKKTKDLLLGIGEQGATRQAITKAQIENFYVKFPRSISEQDTIVNLLEAFKMKSKSLQEAYLKKSNSLDELKKSILQKAFAGELTNTTVTV